ncbi:type III secretion system protein [Klebsiella sp. BIGb0407]|uniref:type III secretion system protein n=1 Tax=Klebsiella sp. BIGb0407 TaxID=2940603 RepID=UPI0021688858|nr:type III secretion system protein [Klebsiella sp. BIGb0407]MCS3431556.1 type III secretion system OrgA/MxiK family protein [Klebsiella sp. BIGb0407]
MKAADSQLMSILYSPVMYIHSDKLLELHSSRNVLNDVILNHWIINQYQLEHLPDMWKPTDVVSILLFNHWQMIPIIVDLIGGYLLRERLLIDKMLLISDAKLLTFISLPLRHSVCVNKQSHITDYSSWGAAFITGLTQHLPVALRQRLSLCFSNNILLPESYIAKTPDNINLLRMAINYAYNTGR